MRYFKAENLTKTYVSIPIINHLFFTIEKGRKIALVAKNGGGKSTLIKLMMGKLDKTDGNVERKRGIRIGYLPQEFNLTEMNTVLDEVFQTNHEAADLIKQYEDLIYSNDHKKLTEIIPLLDEQNVRSYQSKVDTILAKLQLQDLLHQKIKTLSGGEKKRVALAKTLIDEPEMLVLDEPTNHLDLQMIERLEHYLTTEQVTLFMVTHDRYFLERVCDEIYELERGVLYKYPADYGFFLEKQIECHENEQVAQKKLYQSLKRELTWMRKSPRARATKQHFREKNFYKLEEKYDKNKELYISEKFGIEIPLQERRLGTKIVKIRNLKKAFGEKTIVKNFSYDFKFGDRIGLIGKNGVGKSSFLSMITGELDPDGGEIEVGETVVFGEYKQGELQFPKEKTVLDVVKDIAGYIELRNGERISSEMLLERFSFPKNQRYQKAESLSGGEKRRLALICVLMKNPNFLILDEPTNDLDLFTISILEDFLLQFQGCLVIVSHDRSFVNRLVDHLFIFEGDGNITDFWGNYSEWHEKEKSKSKNLEKKKMVKSGNTGNQSQEIEIPLSKLSYENQKELDQLIKDLEKLEKEKAEISQLLNNKDLAFDDISLLSEHLGEITKTIQRKEARWFELLEQN